MRKILKNTALLLALITVLLCLASCEITVNTGDKEKDNQTIVCTVFPQYDFIRNIVGDKMKVELLIPPGSETHAFGLKDLSPAKIEELHGAEMIVSVGGESDETLTDELKIALENSKVVFVDLVSISSDLLFEEETPGMKESEDEDHEHDHDHEEGEEYDEHIWTSPKRAVSLVNALCNEICKLDGENKEYYEKNAEEYIGKLNALDKKYEELTSKKAFDTLIFADRFPFRYLCHDYGLSADAAFKGCSTSIEPPIATLEYLYKKAEELKLPAILYMEGSDPKYAVELASRIGGEALLLHSCHVVSEEDFENETYLTLMEKNLTVLAAALGVKN